MKADQLDVKCLLSILILMLAWNLISGNLGAFSLLTYRYLGFLLFILIIIANASKFHPSWNASYLGSVSMISISLVVLFISPNREYWLLTIPLFLSGLGIYLSESTPFFALSAAGSFYAVLFVLQQHISSFHYSISQISIELSHAISTLSGQSLALGSYVSGFWVIITFSCSIISFFILSEQKNIDIIKFTKSTIGLMLCYIIYIFIISYFITDGSNVIHSQIIIFILCLIPFFYYIHDMAGSLHKGSNLFLRPDAITISLLFISILLIIVFPYLSHTVLAKGGIVVYERNCAIDFDPIRFPGEDETIELIGRRPTAGNLLSFFERAGYKVIRFNKQTNQSLEEVLQGADILLMANLDKPLFDKELKEIWNFVRNGGKLLIFTDHTAVFVNDTDFQKGRGDYFNDLLEPTGIRINSDTADWITLSKTWLRGSWAYPLIIFPSLLTYRIGAEELSPRSVGASLYIAGTAKPIISGPWGFSDNPILSNQGHLGNRIYERGEQIGDVVLVAEDHYGLGNVLVFGDTS